MKRYFAFLFLAVGFAPVSNEAAPKKKTRDEQVIEDRDHLKNNDTWIYNDVAAAKERAQSNGKPMMVVFRCIP